MDITETIKPANRKEWRGWLQENQKTKTEIWLLLDKRPNVPAVEYLDAVEEAICFGWIDGIAKKHSEFEKAQRLTPRRKRSNWTELNKERARRLIRLGLMTDAGQATLPDLSINFWVAEDIVAALKAKPDAWEHFESFPDLYKRVRIGYVEEMRKQPAEFDKRLRNFITKTAAGKMFGNWNDGGRLADEG
ncbi:YdeI/OmpD-associated family protein [Crateriforma conspicua]|uniref:YdeI/OmpD-associated family protein n=1 Tax=Crateriforma conspicua TaxID=2527996 RepID=UPI00119D1D2F|nr:YdeI/OmpD-associated family protein [Crateriforma conspicua]